MTSKLTWSKNDLSIFCRTCHGLSNAVYRLSLSFLVFEFSGGGGHPPPPPGRAKVAQTPGRARVNIRSAQMWEQCPASSAIERFCTNPRSVIIICHMYENKIFNSNYPPPTFVNHVIIGCLATHQSLAKLVNRILRYEDRGGGVHVHRCRDAPPHPWLVEKHVLSDPQPTYQIWTQSVKPFLIYEYRRTLLYCCCFYKFSSNVCLGGFAGSEPSLSIACCAGPDPTTRSRNSRAMAEF